MQTRLIALSAFLCILTIGCSRDFSVPPPIVQPVVKPAPVSVGIYYSKDLRNQKCTGGSVFSWTFEMGDSTTELFNSLFAALFTDVEILHTDPKTSTPVRQRDIIELQLSKFTGCELNLTSPAIEIAYEAIVWSPKGQEVARWEGRGSATFHNIDDFEHHYCGSAASLPKLRRFPMSHFVPEKGTLLLEKARLRLLY